jgi:hypothetical protein
MNEIYFFHLTKKYTFGSNLKIIAGFIQSRDF